MPSKAEVVREYAAAHPKASPAEIAQALPQLRVSPKYVAKVLQFDKKRALRNGLAGVSMVKQLVDQAGGVEEAKRLVDAIAILIEIDSAKCLDASKRFVELAEGLDEARWFVDVYAKLGEQ